MNLNQFKAHFANNKNKSNSFTSTKARNAYTKQRIITHMIHNPDLYWIYFTFTPTPTYPITQTDIDRYRHRLRQIDPDLTYAGHWEQTSILHYHMLVGMHHIPTTTTDPNQYILDRQDRILHCRNAKAFLNLTFAHSWGHRELDAFHHLWHQSYGKRQRNSRFSARAVYYLNAPYFTNLHWHQPRYISHITPNATRLANYLVKQPKGRFQCSTDFGINQVPIPSHFTLQDRQALNQYQPPHYINFLIPMRHQLGDKSPSTRIPSAQFKQTHPHLHDWIHTHNLTVNNYEEDYEY